MIDINQIQQAFTAPDGEQLITLDWDKDIAPLINGGGEVHFHILQGNEIEDAMQQFLALPGLSKTTDIVFNLSVREPYCCKMWQMAMLADNLCTIPSSPSIVWGYTKSHNQHANIKIDVIYRQ